MTREIHGIKFKTVKSIDKTYGVVVKETCRVILYAYLSIELKSWVIKHSHIDVVKHANKLLPGIHVYIISFFTLEAKRC